MRVIMNTAQVYQLREAGPHKVWADIFILEYEHAGTLVIRSDYGSWNYHWSACGKSFKEFLIGMERSKDYFMGKLEGRGQWYLETWVMNALRRINIFKQEKSYDIDDLEAAIREIENIQNQYIQSSDGLYHYIDQNCKHLYHLFIRNNDSPDGFDYSPGLKMFVAEVWPEFVQLLKLEMAPPSIFADAEPMSSAAKKSEAEIVARNIMKILARTGDKFRKLSWYEYREERKKDGNFTSAELGYFNDVIDSCTSAEAAAAFSLSWAQAFEQYKQNIKPADAAEKGGAA